MVKIKGVLNAKTINVFATDKIRQRFIGSKLYFFDWTYVVLRWVFHHEIRHYDVFRYKIHVIAQHILIKKKLQF